MLLGLDKDLPAQAQLSGKSVEEVEELIAVGLLTLMERAAELHAKAEAEKARPLILAILGVFTLTCCQK